MSYSHWSRIALVTAVLLTLPSITSAQGVVLPGTGAVNRSMAGTGVAAPLDAAGALHWNPGSISGLERSEFSMNVELLQLDSHLHSDIPGFGSGSTRSDSGVSGLPSVAVVFKPHDSNWSYGLGLFAVGGFGVNYQANPGNPVVGSIPIYSKLAVMQLVPTASLQVTDRLSIGFAPTLTMAEASLDPNFLATPGPGGYPPATHSRTNWGIGFQVGAYYVTDNCWHFGASYKSPQWFEEFTYYGTQSPGVPRTDRLSMDYPGIISLGTAYYGFSRLVWALDLRYIDYDNAQLFGHEAQFENNVLSGLGWQSVFAVSTGVQYQLTDAVSLRLGYLYNQNPIDDADSFANSASPAIYQHIVSMGLTWQLTCRTGLSLAYLRALENGIQGPAPVPAPPGSTVGSSVAVNALVMGLQVKF